MPSNTAAPSVAVLKLEDLPEWPLPPPSPPSLPPYPPPNRHLNASSHLECNFETGVDISLTNAGSQQGVRHVTDSQIQCCALCAIRLSCRNFVFMPDNHVCALLPLVASEHLFRSNNPATVAGTVFVSHEQTKTKPQTHAECSYDVGRAYSQGRLGQAHSFDGGSQQLTSQQACCDACDRKGDCSKFTYEKYGGVCTLFSPIAEQYSTPGMIAGTLHQRGSDTELLERLASNRKQLRKMYWPTSR
ncbi:hypothetical protein AB1Y20_000595 [Prymnesium parvum]|uniref:Apple domain-containing protein n=1 Tax=Prymnesium parvum TaxID=97485 RepID=A0AB34K714_PRYPA